MAESGERAHGDHRGRGENCSFGRGRSDKRDVVRKLGHLLRDLVDRLQRRLPVLELPEDLAGTVIDEQDGHHPSLTCASAAETPPLLWGARLLCNGGGPPPTKTTRPPAPGGGAEEDRETPR